MHRAGFLFSSWIAFGGSITHEKSIIIFFEERRLVRVMVMGYMDDAFWDWSFECKEKGLSGSFRVTVSVNMGCGLDTRSMNEDLMMDE